MELTAPRLAPWTAAIVWLVAGCGSPQADAVLGATTAVAPAGLAYSLPANFPGPAAHNVDEGFCGAHAPSVGATIFTRYRLPEIHDRGTLRYRALTSAACIRRVDDGFDPLMRQQRWLRGCLQRASVRDLLVEFHIAGDGQVRRIDVVRAEPETAEVAHCIQLATLLDFDARGCSWRRRFQTNGEPLVLEI